MALRWYIVHAYSNFEHRVKAALEERIERMGLQDKFGEILVPTEEVVEMREGQKRRSERKGFRKMDPPTLIKARTKRQRFNIL